jgi:hypothetical protein
MTNEIKEWPSDLSKIAQSDDLHISPLRDDGITYGTPTWIWSVVVDNALYVRAYHGKKSTWYQAALKQKEGTTTVAGMTLSVSFSPVDAALNNSIDDAYRSKYAGRQYLNSMINERARTATIKVEARN